MKMSEKRKRARRLYWISLGIYSAFLLVVAVIAMSIVWRYAEEYEAARPNRVMDEYVAQLNGSAFDGEISEAVSEMKHEIQTDDECIAAIKNILTDGITYVRKSGNSDSQEAVTVDYYLRCGSYNIGTVTLAEDTSKADEISFGMLPWTLIRKDFDFTNLRSTVSVTVPAGYTVELNGIELTDKYIVEKGIHYDVLEEYYKINPELPTKVTYQYDDLFGEMAPVVLDESGNIFVVDENKNDSQFVKPCSEADLSRLEQFGHDFAYAYVTFTSGVGDAMTALGNVTPYIKDGTDLEKRLWDALDGYSWSHTYSIRNDGITFNGATDLGGGFFVVDETTVQTTLAPSGEQTTTNNMKIIVEDSKGILQAVSMEMY